VYSAPLSLAETPLTYAVNLSSRLGCEVSHVALTSDEDLQRSADWQIWLKREDLQPVFSFKIRGAYNMMASLKEEDKRKGVVTCSAGAFTIPT
jgi:threonine dehydratase